MVQYGKMGGDGLESPRSSKSLDIIILLVFTLLLVYDYFPNIFLVNILPKNILMILIFGTYLFSLLFKKYNNMNNKQILKWQILSTIYPLFLISLFTILGGKSSVGLSFNNIGLWIVFLFSGLEMFQQWKKIKQVDKYS